MNQQSQTPVQQGQPAVSKGLLITFIIVILIGAAFAAWYYLTGPGKKVASSTATTTTTPAATTTTTTTTPTTTTTTTADWKTYTNDQLAFSLKYPSDWTEGTTISEIIFSSSKSDIDSLTGKTKAELSGNAIRLDITNEDTSKYSSDTDALNSLEGRKVTTFTKSETTLDQKPVVKYTRTVKKGEAFAENPSVATYDTTEVVYNIINGKKLLRFWFTIDGDKYTSDLADKVFQTVKFTP